MREGLSHLPLSLAIQLSLPAMGFSISHLASCELGSQVSLKSGASSCECPDRFWATWALDLSTARIPTCSGVTRTCMSRLHCRIKVKRNLYRYYPQDRKVIVRGSTRGARHGARNGLQRSSACAGATAGRYCTSDTRTPPSCDQSLWLKTGHAVSLKEKREGRLGSDLQGNETLLQTGLACYLPFRRHQDVEGNLDQ